MRVIGFYIFSILSCIFALCAVTRKNSIHAALFLVLTLLSLALDYLILGSVFLALAQVFVYAGAIVVLFLFVIMLIGSSSDSDARRVRIGFFSGIAAGSILILVLAAKLSSILNLHLRIRETTLQELAAYLIGINGSFGEFALAFELGSVLVLSAMIGAFLLARNRA
ncbi:MAG: hypothetical protein COS94_03600 [Candidatus Hydrogenedentes bacterium CG07_land_8_20_14_0_80_42_17]|nr:MAG: hypothetical protein AUJ18_03415 [Candidatus Hydrogenedentes bacterium CG1_02_42_14]PIU48166.1 MAG: hypothetical protein COS94_03600 [Candidatus Hydrogenedentes bacterium CG07_land_8_20_14_0_80_42_17]